MAQLRDSFCRRLYQYQIQKTANRSGQAPEVWRIATMQRTTIRSQVFPTTTIGWRGRTDPEHEGKDFAGQETHHCGPTASYQPPFGRSRDICGQPLSVIASALPPMAGAEPRGRSTVQPPKGMHTLSCREVELGDNLRFGSLITSSTVRWQDFSTQSPTDFGHLPVK